MSPIASLRNRHYSNTTSSTGISGGPDAIDLAKFPPSFRISRQYGGGGGSTRSSGLRYRANRGKIVEMSGGFVWILMFLRSFF